VATRFRLKPKWAVRAAFKAVMDGKQVAVMAPTDRSGFNNILRCSTAHLDTRTHWECSAFRSQFRTENVLQLLREGGVDCDWAASVISRRS